MSDARAEHGMAGVPSPLRVLHLEDRTEDATLIHAALEGEGLDCRFQTVATRTEFTAAIEAAQFDIILSDFTLPSFDGMSALQIASERAPDIPFILVSGTIGEEAAIDGLRGGATDYILKHRLARLGPAVVRAIQEAEHQRTRRAAEEALARERHFLRAVLDSIHTGLIACDANGALTVFNRAARDIHGIPPGGHATEVPGDHFHLWRADGVIPIERQDLPLLRILRGENVQAAELVVVPRKGPPRRVLASGRVVVDEQGGRLGAVVAFQDVSEERRLTDQLRQAQKMEAIGRLAGGVAQDFNNLLTVILGRGQLLKRRQGVNDTMARDIAAIEQAASRAVELTRQLLAFSRQQVLQPRVLDLNAAIIEAETMLRRLVGKNIQLTMATAPQLGRVKADPGQIEQVLVNLVVNASDAMPRGGKLTIETRNVVFGEGDVGGPEGLMPGSYVLLAVSDKGVGMDQAIRSRIFEPFFTTKESGRGTGLGLSTVHGIVTQSGGHIDVYSEIGSGTTFKIYLPTVEEAGEPSQAPQEIVQRYEGTETVLVVEDEATIREIIRESLQLHGYTVLDAADVNEAIAICERQQPIDVLITDAVTPFKSGPELVQRMVAIRPQLRVLFISGLPDPALVHHELQAAAMASLQMPFTPDVLARRVRELLDEPRRKAA